MSWFILLRLELKGKSINFQPEKRTHFNTKIERWKFFSQENSVWVCVFHSSFFWYSCWRRARRYSYKSQIFSAVNLHFCVALLFIPGVLLVGSVPVKLVVFSFICQSKWEITIRKIFECGKVVEIFIMFEERESKVPPKYPYANDCCGYKIENCNTISSDKNDNVSPSYYFSPLGKINLNTSLIAIARIWCTNCSRETLFFYSFNNFHNLAL